MREFLEPRRDDQHGHADAQTPRPIIPKTWPVGRKRLARVEHLAPMVSDAVS